MTAAWPSALPCRFTAYSQDYEAADNLIRSDMSIGPAKVRRRSTSAVAKLSGDMVMTSAQRDEFFAFVQDDIVSGALPFTFKNPHGTNDILVRYVPPYRVKRFGAGKWVISMQLEILP